MGQPELAYARIGCPTCPSRVHYLRRDAFGGRRGQQNAVPKVPVSQPQARILKPPDLGLMSVRAHILGAVLTKLDSKSSGYGYGYGYTYRYGTT